MYSDNSLLPRETVRLAALGALTMGEMRYGALASNVRHFISRLAGPSLELMGSSIAYNLARSGRNTTLIRGMFSKD